MKTVMNRTRGLKLAGTCVVLGALLFTSCKKDKDTVTEQSFDQVNLVASNNTYTGARVDPNFINGWGIAFSPTGNAWISSEGAGTSVIYDKTGAQVLAAVTIPTVSASTGGSPTGQVFNSVTTDFIIPSSTAAKFIFAGTDGVISAWTAGGAAVKVIDQSATAAYTGLALASDGGNNFLYAANFKAGKIDVFNKTFTKVSKPFTDPNLPTGYAPFNIQNVGGQLYVMYAKVDDATGEEQKGAGLGYVDIYNPDGSFVKRFASQGSLNAPWGIAQAPAGFIKGNSSVILIGNFGDGHINAFDLTGNLLGSLHMDGGPVVIDGLWGISFAPSSATTVDPNWLFFAAGPNDENDGLFGYIKPE
ncbi:MAG TPA: TIGR03118 family protein [Chitinophagaceae bacterium]|nr:TIGR03118 family protein [Chitinophagaceae bacterium]